MDTVFSIYGIVCAVILFAVMAGIYCFAYYFNHKTPKPKGCENLKANCDGCKVTSCMNNPIHDYNKGDNKND